MRASSIPSFTQQVQRAIAASRRINAVTAQQPGSPGAQAADVVARPTRPARKLSGPSPSTAT